MMVNGNIGWQNNQMDGKTTIWDGKTTKQDGKTTIQDRKTTRWMVKQLKRMLTTNRMVKQLDGW